MFPKPVDLGMKGLTAIPHQDYLIAPIVETNHSKLNFVQRITTVCYVAIFLAGISRFSNNEAIMMVALIIAVLTTIASICGHLLISTFEQVGTIELSKKGCSLNIKGTETNFEWSNDSNLKIIYRLGLAGQRNIVNNQLGYTFVEYTEKGIDRKAYFVFTYDDMAEAFLNLVSYLKEEYPNFLILNIIKADEAKQYEVIKQVKQ
jgi:hypothetical protein